MSKTRLHESSAGFESNATGFDGVQKVPTAIACRAPLFGQADFYMQRLPPYDAREVGQDRTWYARFAPMPRRREDA